MNNLGRKTHKGALRWLYELARIKRRECTAIYDTSLASDQGVVRRKGASKRTVTERRERCYSKRLGRMFQLHRVLTSPLHTSLSSLFSPLRPLSHPLFLSVYAIRDVLLPRHRFTAGLAPLRSAIHDIPRCSVYTIERFSSLVLLHRQ